MIVRVDAGVLLLDLLLRIQMIANPRKTCNSHLIDTHNQKTSPMVLPEALCSCVFLSCCWNCVCQFSLLQFLHLGF